MFRSFSFSHQRIARALSFRKGVAETVWVKGVRPCNGCIRTHPLSFTNTRELLFWMKPDTRPYRIVRLFV